jgi:hypothetical protein
VEKTHRPAAQPLDGGTQSPDAQNRTKPHYILANRNKRTLFPPFLFVSGQNMDFDNIAHANVEIREINENTEKKNKSISIRYFKNEMAFLHIKRCVLLSAYDLYPQSPSLTMSVDKHIGFTMPENTHAENIPVLGRPLRWNH